MWLINILTPCTRQVPTGQAEPPVYLNRYSHTETQSSQSSVYNVSEWKEAQFGLSQEMGIILGIPYACECLQADSLECTEKGAGL